MAAGHEIERWLLLGRKAMTNLNSILKSRDIILPTNLHIIKGTVLPVVMYGCECWTIKKAEHWGTDAFKLWCWRRLWRVLWTARRSNKSILREISPEYSLEGLMLKLKLQYSAIWCKELTYQKKPSCWERLRAEEGGNRMRWFSGIFDSMGMSLGKLWEMLKDRETWCAVFHGVAESDSIDWLNNNHCLWVKVCL